MGARHKGELSNPTLHEQSTTSLNPLDRCRRHSQTSYPSTVDEEVLTALLAYSGGVSSAHLLLQQFPSIGHAMAAEESQLGKLGLSLRDINLLRLVHTAAKLLAAGAIRARPMVGNSRALQDYLQTSMACEQVEQLRMIFLDGRNHVIADEVLHHGTINHAPVYPREVVKRALLLNASALIVVHNHPSGDPTPSRADIEMTSQLKRAAAALDLEIHDHIVIGHGEHASFRALGLM